MLLDASTFCADTKEIWKAVGNALTIVKIIIPVILIILAVVTIVKAFLSGDDKKTNEAWGSLLKKLIIAVVIFLLPTLVGAIFKMFQTYTGDTQTCITCLTSPKSC